MPQDVLDEENEYFKRALAGDDHLAMLWKISENGMKQYRRTRSEASKEGVKMTKAIVKGNVIRSLHPLIVGCDPKRCHPGVVEKQEFVRMLQKFRPAQTVFESGIGLGTGKFCFPSTVRDLPHFTSHPFFHYVYLYHHFITYTEKIKNITVRIHINHGLIFTSTGSQAVKAKAKPGSKEYHGTVLRYILLLTLPHTFYRALITRIRPIYFDNRCASNESVS